MDHSRRALLRLLTLSAASLPVSGLAACGIELPSLTGGAPLPDSDAYPDPARGEPLVRVTDEPAGDAGPVATPAPEPTAAIFEPALRPPSVLQPNGTPRSVFVPATPTPLPPTPVPTPTPRPRPARALLTVPYYSQHIGRQNYCLPTSIAMIADRYGRLPASVSGTPDRAPLYVADVAYREAKQRIAALDEGQFKDLWEEIGTDPLGGLIWDVFAPNGRDLAVGMSPALAYLVLTYAFDLTPTLGTLEECLVALGDDIPSILFGSYSALKRADGISPNVSGYTGPHAFVMVGVDYERVLINDPLPSDKIRYSGERSRGSASQRAVRFELSSVRQMTIGENEKPRGDCFMVPPPEA